MRRFARLEAHLRGGGDAVAPQATIDALTARVEHLEAELEALQDAVYRQGKLHDEGLAELRRRMTPAQIAQDLSRDARERGL